MLSFFLTSWRDQFDAMLRAASRLAAIEKDQTPSTARDFGEGYMDELAHFFMDAWHLRDWIAADREIPGGTRRAIATRVGASEVLAIAGNLADRAKHRGNRRSNARKPAPGSEVGFFHFHVGHPWGDRGKSILINLPNGHVRESDDLVSAVLAEWREILEALGLLERDHR